MSQPLKTAPGVQTLLRGPTRQAATTSADGHTPSSQAIPIPRGQFPAADGPHSDHAPATARQQTPPATASQPGKFSRRYRVPRATDDSFVPGTAEGTVRAPARRWRCGCGASWRPAACVDPDRIRAIQPAPAPGAWPPAPRLSFSRPAGHLTGGSGRISEARAVPRAAGYPPRGSACGREELLRRADVPPRGAVRPLRVSPSHGSLSDRRAVQP